MACRTVFVWENKKQSAESLLVKEGFPCQGRRGKWNEYNNYVDAIGKRDDGIGGNLCDDFAIFAAAGAVVFLWQDVKEQSGERGGQGIHIPHAGNTADAAADCILLYSFLFVWDQLRGVSVYGDYFGLFFELRRLFCGDLSGRNCVHAGGAV